MSIFSKAIETMKAQYVPTIDEKVKMTMNGEIACPSGGEYRAFINGEITSIPEEILIDVPIYRISKPVDQIQPGDIIKTFEKKKMKSGNVHPEGKYTYRKVLEVNDGYIKSISFSGCEETRTPVKDFFFGQKTASVVVNLFGSMMNPAQDVQTPFGNMNPMLLMMLAKDNYDTKKLLPFLTMMQNNGQGINPMMFMFMNEDTDMSDAVMLMMMQQNGGFQNLFAGLTPATPVAEEA